MGGDISKGYAKHRRDAMQTALGQKKDNRVALMGSHGFYIGPAELFSFLEKTFFSLCQQHA